MVVLVILCIRHRWNSSPNQPLKHMKHTRTHNKRVYNVHHNLITLPNDHISSLIYWRVYICNTAAEVEGCEYFIAMAIAAVMVDYYDSFSMCASHYDISYEKLHNNEQKSLPQFYWMSLSYNSRWSKLISGLGEASMAGFFDSRLRRIKHNTCYYVIQIIINAKQ